MYVIVKTGGKQYRVQENDTLLIDKINAEPGKTVNLADVLFVEQNGEVFVKDSVKDAVVKAKVIEQVRGKKVLVFKYQKRKRHRKLTGHRQDYTKIQIESIIIKGKKTVSDSAKASPDKQAKEAAKAAKKETKPKAKAVPKKAKPAAKANNKKSDSGRKSSS
ncbi:MAG: 50S ribosomal protein L21 [Actinobacteria bacterium]|nr:MAG: 50S ribosomal protein L21 [Actinomycetota bacterium]